MRTLITFCLLTCSLLIANNDIHAQEPANDSSGIILPETSQNETDLAKDEDIATEPTDKNDSAQSQNQAWAAFVPPLDNFDWIQLKSGEWLKGELKVLYDKTLEFDSDELDLLKLDIDDVKYIRGYGIKGVRLEGPITVYGTLEVTPDKVIVTSGNLPQVFDRSKLIAIASGKDQESHFWSAKISLGMNLTSGNTEQTDYTSIINVKRRTSRTRFVFDYLGNFSRTRGIDTVDNNRLNAHVDVFKTRNYYLRPVFGEYFRDPFQNIEQRYTIGTGIGYHLIDTSRTEWDLTVGLAYQSTQFVSVETGQDPKVSTPALAVGTNYETELSKNVDFIINYSFNVVNEESGTYTHHTITTLETELLSWLDFDISFVWDRIQDPTANADGTIPEQDDFRLIFSLGLDY